MILANTLASLTRRLSMVGMPREESQRLLEAELSASERDAAFVRGVWPSYLQMIYSNFLAAFGGFAGLAIVVFGVGYFVCRSKTRRR